MVAVQVGLVEMVEMAVDREATEEEVGMVVVAMVVDVVYTRREMAATVEREHDAKAYTSPSYEKRSRSDPL